MIVILVIVIIVWRISIAKKLASDTTVAVPASSSASSPPALLTKADIVAKFAGVEPKEWGLDSVGVKTKLDTSDKVVALTFDACGSTGGGGYDEDLINYLVAEKIPATLFINSRWIDANPEVFKQLSNNEIFEIANHGVLHKPCSANGQEAYGVKGTADIAAMVDEIQGGSDKIESLTAQKPKYFRAGTAYTDEICPQVAAALGEQVVNFSINGDAGAAYSAQQVREALLKATGGEIIIAHMNHPEGDTAEGYKLAIPELLAQGFNFVKLSQYKLK